MKRGVSVSGHGANGYPGLYYVAKDGVCYEYISQQLVEKTLNPSADPLRTDLENSKLLLHFVSCFVRVVNMTKNVKYCFKIPFLGSNKSKKIDRNVPNRREIDLHSLFP